MITRGKWFGCSFHFFNVSNIFLLSIIQYFLCAKIRFSSDFFNSCCHFSSDFYIFLCFFSNEVLNFVAFLPEYSSQKVMASTFLSFTSFECVTCSGIKCATFDNDRFGTPSCKCHEAFTEKVGVFRRNLYKFRDFWRFVGESRRRE